MKQTEGDHCSCWPDGDWGEVCHKHDQAYDKGGWHWTRWRADFALGWGVICKAKWYTLWFHIPMGIVMFFGVRIFASRPVSWITRGAWGRQHRFNWGQKRKGESDAS